VPSATCSPRDNASAACLDPAEHRHLAYLAKIIAGAALAMIRDYPVVLLAGTVLCPVTVISAWHDASTCAGLLNCQRCRVIHDIQFGPHHRQGWAVPVIAARQHVLDLREAAGHGPAAAGTGPGVTTSHGWRATGLPTWEFAGIPSCSWRRLPGLLGGSVQFQRSGLHVRVRERRSLDSGFCF
jgi:hypothetical protein